MYVCMDILLRKKARIFLSQIKRIAMAILVYVR